MIRAGGTCPTVLVCDNLSGLSLERMGDAVRSSAIVELAAHHDCKFRLGAPRQSNEDGRVERRVVHARTGFLVACSWRDLEEREAHVEAWWRARMLERPGSGR
jgi:hypothetical protein